MNNCFEEWLDESTPPEFFKDVPGGWNFKTEIKDRNQRGLIFMTHEIIGLIESIRNCNPDSCFLEYIWEQKFAGASKPLASKAYHIGVMMLNNVNDEFPHNNCKDLIEQLADVVIKNHIESLEQLKEHRQKTLEVIGQMSKFLNSDGEGLDNTGTKNRLLEVYKHCLDNETTKNPTEDMLRFA